MTEENRPTPASERIAPQPKAPDSFSQHTSAQANGQEMAGPANRTAPRAKIRAWGLRLAVSAIMFVVLALLSIGIMIVTDFKPQTAFWVGILGSFLAVMAVQNFLPSSARHHTDESGKPAPDASQSLSGDLLMLLRWLAGLLIVTLCGWVIMGVTAYIFCRTEGDSYAYDLALFIASVLSFGAFYVLEPDMWLSRFMGLPVGPNASPLLAA